MTCTASIADVKVVVPQFLVFSYTDTGRYLVLIYTYALQVTTLFTTFNISTKVFYFLRCFSILLFSTVNSLLGTYIRNKVQ